MTDRNPPRRRGVPGWWPPCAGGWCGGAFLCDRHTHLQPQHTAWLLDDTAEAG